MSLSFATVAEGATDHAVLENILLGLCKHHNLEPGDIVPVQPLVDETGKQRPESPGGWQQVFLWLQKKHYREAFQLNEHVVIQIDTDMCDQVGFGVSKILNDQRNVAALITEVRNKLEQAVDPADLEYYAGRFHFAVAVHSIECWLLPIWGKNSEINGIHTCKERVDAGLARANERPLVKNEVRTYDKASAPLRKSKGLQNARKSQESLRIFLSSMDAACSSYATKPLA